MQPAPANPQPEPLQRVVLYTEDDPLELSCGRTLAPVEVAFTTVGTLNEDRSNAVFVCHALTGDAHSAGADGWWGQIVGPGRPVDTDRFFVITPNLLGGCQGTTGPASVDPATGEPYGWDFPPIAVADLVAVHRRLLAHLGIDTVHTAIGGSLGGMQIIEWLLQAPGQIDRAAIIAATSLLSPQNLAFSAAARSAILADPERMHDGMGVARRIAHLTYLSERGMERKFPRDESLQESVPTSAEEWLASSYEVERYLDHQASTFLDRFDPFTYLWLSRVMDAFNPFAESTRKVDTDTQVLVASFTSDWRFGRAHSDRIVDGLRERGAEALYQVELESDAGHDAFLFDVPGYAEALSRLIDGA